MSNLEKSTIAETDPVQPVEGAIPIRLKRTIQIAGLVLFILGLPVALNLICVLPLMSFIEGGTDVLIYGVVSLTFALLTVGAGWTAFLHADRSLHNKPSRPLRLPPLVLLVGIFLFAIGLGMIVDGVDVGAGLFFPFLLVACALLPPLWALAWMIPPLSAPPVPKPANEASAPEETPANPIRASLTWRRGLLAFTGGATVSVFIAIMLEILLPVIVLSLVVDFADTVLDSLRGVFRDLSNTAVAAALTDRSFIYIFVQLAIIAPLVEEIAKPLVTLPLLRRLNKQEAFWIGALAGAGFAAIENVIYATTAISIWAGVLVVRALGSALHPLGSGLVAQGWRDVLRGEKDAGKNWLKRFGIAVAIHAAWNGGSLLVITLGGARFFGKLPPELGLLGLSAAGTTLAFLIILGFIALWIGRLYGRDKPILRVEGEAAPEAGLIATDRALAVWALACLIAIVPAGIAGLKLWLR